MIAEKTTKKPENAILVRFPAFKQQAKERSSLLFPRIMTRMSSHSMSPPGHPLRGFPLGIRVLSESFFLVDIELRMYEDL
jgi:hypothetical protein